MPNSDDNMSANISDVTSTEKLVSDIYPNVSPTEVRASLRDYQSKDSRRRFLKNTAYSAAALFGTYELGLNLKLPSIPEVYGETQEPSQQTPEEFKLQVPKALKPISPDDLKTKSWTSADYWNDSVEFGYGANTSHYGYLRFKWGDYCALLADAVTDTAEKQNGGVTINFDTENKRFEIKDPSVPKTPGFYAAKIHFSSPGGQLEDFYQGKSNAPGNNFPSGKLYFTWSRAQSPIANNDESRLKEHALYCILVEKGFLTSKNQEIGGGIRLWRTQDLDYKEFPGIGYAKTSFPDLDYAEVSEFTLLQRFLALGLSTTLAITLIQVFKDKNKR